MSLISVCIISNRWNALLEQVVASCMSFADEVLIGVNDNNIAVNNEFIHAHQVKLKIKLLEWKGYGLTKNNLAQEAHNDWILSLDSDEIIDERLQKYLRSLKLSDENNIYELERKNFIGDTWIRYGTWGRSNQKIPRLYHRRIAHWNDSVIHEKLTYPTKAKVQPTLGAINHMTASSIEEVATKMKAYADKKAATNTKAKNILIRYIKAAFAFVKDYLLLSGVRNEKYGLDLAKIHASYTFHKYGVNKK